MTPTIIIAHAALTAAMRARYEAAAPGWRIVPLISSFPGMSLAYTALAADLRRRSPGTPLLSALLRHLKIDDAGPVVFAWFSAGYAFARELAADPASRAAVSAWIGIDGMHTDKDRDGTASDAGVSWLVSLAQEALVGGTVLALGHSDVKTYGTTASTTQVAAEVRRLSGMPEGERHGGLVIRPYNVRAVDHDEHVAALREWGADLVREALSLLPAVTLTATVPSTRPTQQPTAAHQSPGTTTATLRRGDSGPRVVELQKLLTAAGWYTKADGAFGGLTEAAVKAFQDAHGLDVDGIAGKDTMGVLRAAAADAPPDTEPAFDLTSAPLPLGDAERVKVFGSFDWVPAPREGEPGAIRILGNWVRENIVTITIPQLVGVKGCPSGRVTCHRLAAPTFQRFFAAVEAAGKMPLVLTWDGCWNPRLVRGGSSLSNHSWGVDFDINAQWNARGTKGAARGERGSLVEIDPIAVASGLGCGRGWSTPDAMHYGALRA